MDTRCWLITLGQFPGRVMDTVATPVGRDDVVLGLGDGGGTTDICDRKLSTLMLAHWHATARRPHCRSRGRARADHRACPVAVGRPGPHRRRLKGDVNVIDHRA